MQDESIPFEETKMPIPNVDAGFDHNKDGAGKKRRLKRSGRRATNPPTF